VGKEKMARGRVMDEHGQAEMPPRDFAALRERVISRWEELPRRLTQVAEYALNNPDDVAFGTAASIAAKAHVQPSTLVRFSQALAIRGFPTCRTFSARGCATTCSGTTSAWRSCASMERARPGRR